MVALYSEHCESKETQQRDENNCSTIVRATAVLFFLLTIAKHSTFPFTFASASFSPRDNFRTFQCVCNGGLRIFHIQDYSLPKLLKMNIFDQNS